MGVPTSFVFVLLKVGTWLENENENEKVYYLQGQLT
jgi:hypothetical protein